MQALTAPLRQAASAGETLEPLRTTVTTVGMPLVGWPAERGFQRAALAALTVTV